MRIKELFTVPEGKKVTEKVFARVLLSSVCSILLCMACLAGTTWAWFTVSLENRGNEIRIAQITANTKVTTADSEITPAEDGSYTLTAGTYSISIGLKQEETAEAANLLEAPTQPVYVVMKLSSDGNTQYRYFRFTSKGEPKNHTLTIHEGTVELRFSASWATPAEDQPVDEAVTVTGASAEQEASDNADTVTDLSTDPAATPSSEPEEDTEEAASEPAEDTQESTPEPNAETETQA